MATYFRRDDWVTDAMGNAISGAGVYVTSQPSTPGSLTKQGYVPPSPLVQLYADPAGVTPVTQPVLTDGYGHAFYYAASNIYTVTYYSPQIRQTTLADQVIAGVVAPISSTALSGAQNGTNRVFTLPSIPTNFSMIFVNGVYQVLSINYTISGLTITFTTAPLPTDELFAVYQ
jgi:hypothetical protein